MNKILMLAAVLLFPALAWGQSYLDLVSGYMQALNRPEGPSISDAVHFEGGESELRMELMVCEEKGWSPQQQDERCVEFTKDRAEQAQRAESIYLSWIRTKIADTADVSVQHVETTDQCDRIHVRAGSTVLVFLRFHDPTLFVPLGHFPLAEVNGTDVADLLRSDRAGGLRLGGFVKTW